MIYKIIHNDFQINLIDKAIDFTEQNQWFFDGAPINYTLPINMTLTQEMDEAFKMISHVNAQINTTSFDVKLYKMEKVYDAILYIESIDNRQIQLSFKYGFEEYPNFSKDLRKLPLEQKSVDSLRADGLIVKSQIWPETNYKYPAAITPADILENDSGRFDYFENILNLLENGEYVENTFDENNNESINRTIMQPFAYLLHVLIVGFADAGFTLVGDILQDEKIKKILTGCISDYYTNFQSDQEEWVVNTLDLTPIAINPNGSAISDGVPDEIADRFEPENVLYLNTGWFYEERTFSEPGRYKIAGNINLRRNPFNRAFFYIFIDGVMVKKITRRFVNFQRAEEFFTFDYNFDVETSSEVLIYSQQGIFFSEENEPIEAPVIDFTITKLATLENGNFIPSVVEANEVKLNETMPEKTFGDLVKAVMAWRNYDISIDVATQSVVMNKITKTITNPVNQDISQTEVRFPLREFNEAKSYLLQFQPKQDDTDYEKVLYSRRGAQTNEIVKDENTEEINIDLYPLLNSSQNEITTAKFQDKADSDIVVFYHDGNQATNTTPNTNDLLLPEILEEDYEDWLNFRLYATVFKWKNILSIEEALLLSVYNKSFAYNQSHYIKQLIVRLIDKDFAEVEFETEA